MSWCPLVFVLVHFPSVVPFPTLHLVFESACLSCVFDSCNSLNLVFEEHWFLFVSDFADVLSGLAFDLA